MDNNCINWCNSCSGQCAVSKVPIFENLNNEELIEVVKTIEHKEYSKGNTIFIEGDTANTLYFINEGKIKLYKHTKDGKEQILHVLSEGDFW